MMIFYWILLLGGTVGVIAGLVSLVLSIEKGSRNWTIGSVLSILVCLIASISGNYLGTRLECSSYGDLTGIPYHHSTATGCLYNPEGNTFVTRSVLRDKYLTLNPSFNP